MQKYNTVLLWPACCMAFFGFLRCGEFTVPSQTDYDPDTHLSLTDIALDDKAEPSVNSSYYQTSEDRSIQARC